MPAITLRRPLGAINGTIALPRSKSVSNRALVAASIAGDISCVHGASTAEDTIALHQLLIERPREMHCGAGGTTFRFALAWAAVQVGEERTITGDERLLARPHQDLVNGARMLGASIRSVPGNDAPPFKVLGKELQGGVLRMDSPVSSQFISALLLVAPRMLLGLELHWTGLRLSEPYVRMTLKVLRHFGADVRIQGAAIIVRAGALVPTPLEVPCDWSSAAFWYQIMALNEGSEVLLAGLRRDGWQGDEAAMHLWAPWVETQVTTDSVTIRSAPEVDRHPTVVIDLASTPDLFQALAVTHAVRGVPVRFTGLHNLPLKESDRLTEMKQLLEHLGLHVEVDADSFALSGLITRAEAITIDPKHDHRIAMACAPLCHVCDAVTITDAGVVRKSYTTFWEDLRTVGYRA